MVSGKNPPKKGKHTTALPPLIPEEQLMYPLVVRRPLSVYAPSLCQLIPGLMVLLVILVYRLKGALDIGGYRLQLAGVIFLGSAMTFLGAWWFLSGFLVKLTFPDPDHVTIRNLRGTRDHALADLRATVRYITQDRKQYALDIRDGAGKILCSIEKSRHFDRCRAVFAYAERRQKRNAVYRMLLRQVWCCPVRENSLCVKVLEDESVPILFGADSVALAKTLAEDPDGVAHLTLKGIADIAIENADHWFIALRIGDDARYIIEDKEWEDVLEILNLEPDLLPNPNMED